jgi:hypothetical protein
VRLPDSPLDVGEDVAQLGFGSLPIPAVLGSAEVTNRRSP